jgi:hypothetical protein
MCDDDAKPVVVDQVLPAPTVSDLPDTDVIIIIDVKADPVDE